MWSIVHIAVAALACLTLLPYTYSQDGSMSVQVFSDTNCTQPYNGGLLDFNSFYPSHDVQYGWSCTNDLGSAVVDPRWSLLRTGCNSVADTTQQHGSYVILSAMWYENVTDCNDHRAIGDNYTYYLAYSTPQPVNDTYSVMGVCQNNALLDAGLGGDYVHVAGVIFHCNFSTSGGLSYWYGPTARYMAIAVAAVSVVVSAAMGGWIAG